MITDTKKSKSKVVLDTNIVISAIGFGGKPRKVLLLIINKQVQGITSSILLAELQDVISKKFPLLASKYEKILKLIKRKTKLVKPTVSLHIVKDEPNNRVLESAVAGSCHYIITGDKELLRLNQYRGIKITTAEELMVILENN